MTSAAAAKTPATPLSVASISASMPVPGPGPGDPGPIENAMTAAPVMTSSETE